MNLSFGKREILVIAVVWILIFASAPLYMFYALLVSDFEFDWHEIFLQWSYLTAYLFLFLVHHFVLVPRLLVKKRIKLFVLCTVACLAVFTVFLVWRAPEFAPKELPADVLADAHRRSPHALLAPPDLARLVMAVLLLVADMGAVAWINEQRLRQRLLLLEQQALKQELTHLRFQINPHFFMNTLNNIHQLVDVDKERAQRAIVELSGMMRYSLYEGNGAMIPMQHEVEFINLYISLMKLRFNNKVEIVCQIPETTPAEVMMPPLLLATFVENAFKHGISYQQPSLISIFLALEDANSKIHFRCVNILHENKSVTEDGHHGIGLANVRKRLDLQYGDKYTLNIGVQDDAKFVVDLVLPVNNS